MQTLVSIRNPGIKILPEGEDSAERKRRWRVWSTGCYQYSPIAGPHNLTTDKFYFSLARTLYRESKIMAGEVKFNYSKERTRKFIIRLVNITCILNNGNYAWCSHNDDNF